MRLSVSATPTPAGRLKREEQRKGPPEAVGGKWRSSSSMSCSSRERVWLGEGPAGGMEREAASRRSIRQGGSEEGEGQYCHHTHQWNHHSRTERPRARAHAHTHTHTHTHTHVHPPGVWPYRKTLTSVSRNCSSIRGSHDTLLFSWPLPPSPATPPPSHFSVEQEVEGEVRVEEVEDVVGVAEEELGMAVEESGVAEEIVGMAEDVDTVPFEELDLEEQKVLSEQVSDEVIEEEVLTEEEEVGVAEEDVVDQEGGASELKASPYAPRQWSSTLARVTTVGFDHSIMKPRPSPLSISGSSPNSTPKTSGFFTGDSSVPRVSAERGAWLTGDDDVRRRSFFSTWRVREPREVTRPQRCL